MTAPPVSRPDVNVRIATDGATYVTDRRQLGPWPSRYTDWLDDWAARAPERPFLVERRAGAWVAVTYAEARTRVRVLAQALLDRRLSADRPLMLLSGNGIDHGLLALAAMYSGVPYAPVSPAYSLQSRDLAVLKQIVSTMRPGLVFADNEARFDRALGAFGTDVEVVTTIQAGTRRATPLDTLAKTRESADVDAAHASITPDTVAKVLFTSGSTGHPKGVMNTHRMLGSNQAMLRAVFPFLLESPLTLCDWLPWHHTAGGNHNFGMVLANGGTLYIDGGRPTPEGIETTVANLRDVAADVHFTVPRAYEVLLPFLKADPALRSTFFSRLRFFFYAGAGLGQGYMDAWQALSVETTGRTLPWVTGFGATETAPFSMSTGDVGARAGFVGFPVPGVELKLSAVGPKVEARVRGPNVMPGYWRNAALTAASFDEDGFYRTGDALRLVNPDNVAEGFVFDGRLTEDFKLSTGTWVSVGPLRARALLHLEPYVQDVVIAAPNRPFVTALLLPNLTACRQLCSDLMPDAAVAAVLDHPRVRSTLQRLLTELAAHGTGSSTRIDRAILVGDPPSIDRGEITDKGSLNQQTMLRTRSTLIEELYAPAASPRTIVVR